MRQVIDPEKADMTIFDSSGIEAFVTNGLGIVRHISFNPLVAVWCIYTLKRISVHIQAPYVTQMNGTASIKSEL